MSVLHYAKSFMRRLPWNLTRLLFALGFMLLVTPARLLGAQAAPSATARGLTIWAGGQYSNFQTDFEGHRMGGMGVYADFDRTSHWSAEAEARWFHFGGGNGQTAADYLIGGRYRFPLQNNKMFPYAKFLVGSGVINYPSNIGHGSYFIYVPGAGVDFRTSHRISFRVEYEYQRWPSAPGFPGYPSHGLAPNGFNLGVAWRLF
jgi:opacity protein-like surface antigen